MVQQARQALYDRWRRLQAEMANPDPFGAATVPSAASMADMPRALGERGIRGLADLAVTPGMQLGPLPLGGLGRGVLNAGQYAQAAPDLLRLLAGVATAPLGPNQPIETALAASEAGMGAGSEPGPSAPAPVGFHRMPDGTLMPGDAMPAQAPLGAPTAGSPMPPTPPGGLTSGDSGGGLPPMRRVDDIASAYPGASVGLQSTALAPLPSSSTSLVGQRVDTTPGTPGALTRVDDITSSYSPRRILGMPGQTAAGLPLPSTLGGAGGLSPSAVEEITKNPGLYADILNQQRGRSPSTDMWASKERTDAAQLQQLYPLFEDPNNPNKDAQEIAYLQSGIQGRRQPGGRLDFRGALLAKLGDEAGSKDVLDALGIPMDMTPDQVPAAARQAAMLVGRVQLQGGRLPALAQARAQRVEDEITRQHVLALQSGESFGQPQISAIIRSLA